MVVRRKGDTTRASPCLVACFSLDNSLGCHGNPQAQALLTPCSFIHRNMTQNMKTSITQNSTKLREIRQYKKANHYHKYCCKPIHILVLHYIYCIPSFLWQKLFKGNHRIIKTSTQHKENRIIQKQNNLQQSEYFVYLHNLTIM